MAWVRARTGVDGWVHIQRGYSHRTGQLAMNNGPNGDGGSTLTFLVGLSNSANVTFGTERVGGRHEMQTKRCH